MNAYLAATPEQSMRRLFLTDHTPSGKRPAPGVTSQPRLRALSLAFDSSPRRITHPAKPCEPNSRVSSLIFPTASRLPTWQTIIYYQPCCLFAEFLGKPLSLDFSHVTPLVSFSSYPIDGVHFFSLPQNVLGRLRRIIHLRSNELSELWCPFST